MAVDVKNSRKQRNAGGSLFVVIILVLLVIGGAIFSGGIFPTPTGSPTGAPPQDATEQQEIVYPTGSDARNTLQLQTFTVNTCRQKTAVDFVIDVSGSMQFDGKIGKEKDALTAFTNQLAENAVLGMETFSNTALQNVPISYYRDVKSQAQSTINNLQAGGWTHTRDAFALANQQLSAAISQNKFPGYQYSMILLTDGVPEVPNPTQCEVVVKDSQQGNRCFAADQDPRIPTDISASIKNLGVQIYSIAITSTKTSDVALQPYLEKMLTDVASQPTSTHFYTSLNADNLKVILTNIIQKICESPGQ